MLRRARARAATDYRDVWLGVADDIGGRTCNAQTVAPVVFALQARSTRVAGGANPTHQTDVDAELASGVALLGARVPGAAERTFDAALALFAENDARVGLHAVTLHNRGIARHQLRLMRLGQRDIARACVIDPRRPKTPFVRDYLMYVRVVFAVWAGLAD